MAKNEISIDASTQDQVKECLSILLDSVLGEYFEPPLASSMLNEGDESHNLFVARKNNEILGFYLVAEKGAFLVFPYLHLLAVKSGNRSQGVGASLLKHFEKSQIEKEGYPFRVKTFLLVSEENKRAIAFYERNGYENKAVFDDMFNEGDTELLMMKDLGEK